MVDNDRLLEDFGEPVHQNTVVNGEGRYTIKHAFLIGKHNVQFINICETYNPYNDWEKWEAIKRAKDNWRKTFYNIKSH